MTYQPLTRGPTMYVQDGGLKFSDVTKKIGQGVAWAKKNKPLKKALEFADKVVPASVQANPMFARVRGIAGQVSEQLGIGHPQQIHVHVHAARPKKRQTGGRKKAGKRKRNLILEIRN